MEILHFVTEVLFGDVSSFFWWISGHLICWFQSWVIDACSSLFPLPCLQIVMSLGLRNTYPILKRDGVRRGSIKFLSYTSQTMGPSLQYEVLARSLGLYCGQAWSKKQIWLVPGNPFGLWCGIYLKIPPVKNAFLLKSSVQTQILCSQSLER